MAKRCPTCRQPVPEVEHCVCGCTRSEHSIRENRRKVLTRARCFTVGCPCRQYRPLSEQTP